MNLEYREGCLPFSMRTLHLIKSLSDSELKEVELLLNEGKRQNLLLLFRYLKKWRPAEKAPSVAELLKKIFGQKHTKPNELQLRNKLSRLNDILYQYLANAEFQIQLSANENLFNLWLLQSFRRRKLPLLKTDMDGFIKTAMDGFMLDEALPMLRLRALLGAGEFEKNLRITNDWQQAEKQRFLLHYTLAESTKALYYDLENNRLQTKDSIWKKYEAPDYRFDFADLKKDWYFNLFENNRLSLTAGNEAQKIDYLKRAAKATEGVQTKYMALRGVRGNILQNIAVTLLQKNCFEEAHDYLLEHMRQQKTEGIGIEAVCWVNYLAVLSCLGELEKVKTVYTENKALITDSPFAMPALIMYCSACIFTNCSDTAIKAMPDIARLLDYEKLVIRNLYTLAFIMRGDIELAYTEVTNLKRAIAGFEQTEYVRDLAQTTLLLHEYIAVLKAEKKKRSALAEKIKIKVNRLLGDFESDPVQNIALKWILKQAEEICQ